MYALNEVPAEALFIDVFTGSKGASRFTALR
jgi:hypothetical protein